MRIALLFCITIFIAGCCSTRSRLDMLEEQLEVCREARANAERRLCEIEVWYKSVSKISTDDKLKGEMFQ